MNIGILTFHDGINHGAYLQAFGTYNFLRELNHDVEIINYKNAFHRKAELKVFLFHKNPLLIVSNIRKMIAFYHDQKFFRMDKQVYSVDEIDDRYDAIVVGSDVVWNYSDKFLGQDPIYFGHGLKAERIVSYAPSSGKLDLARSVPSYVAEGLPLFHSVSVRDENTARMVQNIAGFKPPIVVDPTFLTEYTGYEDASRVPDGDFILVYAYKLTDKEVESVKRFSAEKKIKIVSIGYKNRWADKNIINIGPFEWLAFFRAAKYVLTSTFHGTIFSIIYKKNFVVSVNENIKNKVSTILSRVDLLHRLAVDADVYTVLSESPDYAMVYSKLDPMIDSSKSYLKSALAKI